MDAREIVERLDGAHLEKANTQSWHGFFLGSVGVENVVQDAVTLGFDVVVPTAANDIEDYIWAREREAGRTDKVALAQAGRDLPSARVVNIQRVGPDRRWSPGSVDQYRLTFELDIRDVQPDQPLDLLIRWRQTDADDWTVIARATGS